MSNDRISNRIKIMADNNIEVKLIDENCRGRKKKNTHMKSNLTDLQSFNNGATLFKCMIF